MQIQALQPEDNCSCVMALKESAPYSGMFMEVIDPLCMRFIIEMKENSNDCLLLINTTSSLA